MVYSICILYTYLRKTISNSNYRSFIVIEFEDITERRFLKATIKLYCFVIEHHFIDVIEMRNKKRIRRKKKKKKAIEGIDPLTRSLSLLNLF